MGCSDSNDHPETRDPIVKQTAGPIQITRPVFSSDDPGELAFEYNRKKFEIDLFEGEFDIEGMWTGETEWDFPVFEQYYTMAVLQGFLANGAEVKFYHNRPDSFAMIGVLENGSKWMLRKSESKLTLNLGEIKLTQTLMLDWDPPSRSRYSIHEYNDLFEDDYRRRERDGRIIVVTPPPRREKRTVVVFPGGGTTSSRTTTVVMPTPTPKKKVIPFGTEPKDNSSQKTIIPPRTGTRPVPSSKIVVPSSTRPTPSPKTVAPTSTRPSPSAHPDPGSFDDRKGRMMGKGKQKISDPKGSTEWKKERRNKGKPVKPLGSRGFSSGRSSGGGSPGSFGSRPSSSRPSRPSKSSSSSSSRSRRK